VEGVIAAAFYYAWGFASGGVKPSANVLKKIAGVLNIGVGIVKKRIKEIGDVLYSLTLNISYIKSPRKPEIFMHISDILSHVSIHNLLQLPAPDPPSYQRASQKTSLLIRKISAAKTRIYQLSTLSYEEDPDLDEMDLEIQKMLVEGVDEGDIVNARFKDVEVGVPVAGVEEFDLLAEQQDV